MKKDDYPAEYHDHLLEQYKLFITTSENLLDRRLDTNKLYTSILSGLLAILALVSKVTPSDITSYILLIISISGIILCIVWYINIISYKQFSDGKFKVIHEIEKNLPFQCFKVEWDILGKGKKPRKYLLLTRVERCIPFLLALPYISICLYLIKNLI